MQKATLERRSEFEWVIPQSGRMQVPAVIYAAESLIEDMDPKVQEQLSNVAALPGIQRAAYAMPDAHWGYGFPIGGVAAFDPHRGGVVSAGGVGFDISCGVRTLLTGVPRRDLEPLKERVADALYRDVPAGVGSTGQVRMNMQEIDAMLRGGARWAVERGYGSSADLERIEEGGSMATAEPARVSPQAKKRQLEEMGTLGSGNHYLEIQRICEVYDETRAAAFGIHLDDILVSIHCGSRGLGHQVATDYSKTMLTAAAQHGIRLTDRELACAPALAPEGQAYLGAMNAAINCALANRQILTALVRAVFKRVFGSADLPVLYDVSHNTCKEEEHEIDGLRRRLLVHRKGATRAFGPGHPSLPPCLREAGQPVLIGGTMGTASYILAGTVGNESLSFGSACHGAGRNMSRTEATRRWQGRDIVESLARRHILIRCRSTRGVAEEAPQAYKDVSSVVDSTHSAGLAIRVARMEPLVCIKG